MSAKPVLNLPNGLTVFRIVVLPLLAILIVKDHRLWATIVIAIAGLSDILDGWYARHYRLESSFGKLMDPVADKILLCVTVLFLVARAHEGMSAWLGTLLLAREFLITGLRALAASAGLVIGAKGMGKAKMLFQFVGLGAVVLGDAGPAFLPVYQIGLGLLWISVVLSYWSMVMYLRLVYRQLPEGPTR